MRPMKFGAVMLTGLLLPMAGCIDKDYDLSDIDTTVRVPVNDLAVPIKIDNIELRSIIDTDKDIQIVDDSYYAYVNTGTFTSSSIKINPIQISVGDIDPITTAVDIPSGGTPIDGVLPNIVADVPETLVTYNFSSQNVSRDIVDLFRVEGRINISVTISTTGLEGVSETQKFAELNLQLPAGLTMSAANGIYDQKTGVLTLKDVNATNTRLDIEASAIDIPAGVFDYADHTVSFGGLVGISGGRLEVSNLSGAVPERVSINLGIEISDIDVTSVDGIVQYDIKDVNVPDIDINNLPGVLSQKGTNLVLTNPQLYFSINNPLYSTGLYAQTGFEIASYHGEESKTYAIDQPYFTIGANAVNEFCLSPSKPQKFDSEFPNSTHVGYAALSYVLSGDGLPDKLSVAMPSPAVPAQKVSNFLIGHDYGEISGNYKFLAPLQFDGGTQIYYSDKLDGWADDDLDKITIQKITVALNITTDVPLGVELTGYPINTKGNRIAGVTVSPVNIPALASDCRVEIEISGEVRDLDGLEFVAKAHAADNGAVLAPGMHIVLSNIRPRVTGYYQDEL